MPPQTQLYASLFALAFVTALAVTAVMIRLAPRLGLVDHPAGEKFHHVATPLGGGIALYLACATVLLFPAMRTTHTLLVVAAGALLAAVGLWDDFRGVPATVKFAILVTLTVALSRHGVAATTTRIGVIDLVITVLWVTGVSSAFNAIDNMDGLSTGVASIAALAFFIVAVQTQQWGFGGLCLALVGANLGFLVFNFPPARIFMGDAGSFFLGFTLACLGVLGDWSSNPVIAAVIPILVLGLPIFDLSFTVVVRHFTGVTRTFAQALNHCGTDHVSHRLVRLGLGTRGTLAVLYLIAASFAISAVSLENAVSAVGVLHLIQALVVAGALAFLVAAPGAASAAPPTAGPAAARTAWLPLGMVAAVLTVLLVLRLAL